MRFLRNAILPICGCLLSVTVFSQDNHYEGLQLGSKNALLSGAAVSKWVDQTAVVINAATMMNAQEAGITFNTTTGSLDNIVFRNGLGDDLDIKTSNAQLHPGLIAADLPILKDEANNRMGISIFRRIDDRTRFTSREEYMQNIIDDAEAPGMETFIGQYVLDIELTETTAALGWATRLSPTWSAGLATMAHFRSHRYRENFSAAAVADPAFNPAVDLVSAESDISLKASFALLQIRGSLAWQSGPWNAGFVLTLPSIRVWSDGDMIAEASLVNIKPDSLSERKSYLASAFLDKQKPVFRYPVSVSAGVSRSFGAVTVSTSASWYGAVDRYVVIDPGDTPYLQPPSSENILYTQRFLEVWSSNRSLVNGAVSGEWTTSPRLSLMAGFRTDLHYAQFFDPLPPGFQLPKKIWNRYHVNFGAAFSNRFSRWIVGLQYSYGHADNYRQPYSLDNAGEGNLLQGERETGTIYQNGLTGVLSFLFFVDRERTIRKPDE
ncbi:MAG: hypothetical protein SFV52_14020 [Saprospiraceae bacterium]|nr:hypothetical protein [Saprospiraceae bacterium]